MKKALLGISLFICFSAVCIAQPSIQWQNMFPYFNDRPSCLKQTADGGYIVSLQGFIIIKANQYGVMEWVKNYKSGGAGSNVTANGIVQNADGTYLAVGTSDSTNTYSGTMHGGLNYWAVKMDQAGNMLWQKSFGGSNTDYGYGVAAAADGGYVIVGETFSSDGDVTGYKGAGDAWVVKIDSSGNLQWQKTYGGSSTEWPSKIINTADGGYAFISITSSVNGDVTGSHGSEEYWLAKITADGTFQWGKCYGGSNYDDGFSLIQMKDHGYVLSGKDNSNNGQVTGHHGTTSSIDDWVVRTDSAGNFIWGISLGGTSDDVSNSLVEADDGGVYVSSIVASTDGNVNAPPSHNITSANTDFWLVKLTSGGTIQWQRCYGGSSQESAYSFFNSGCMVKTSDGGLVFVCTSASHDGDVKTAFSPGIWLVKVLDQSNAITGKAYYDLNNNNIFDTGDKPMYNGKIVETQTGNITFTDADGSYRLEVPDSGNYTAQPEGINYYTATPATQPAHFAVQVNGVDTANNFAFHSTGSYNDLSVTLTNMTGFRRGFEQEFLITYTNVGTTTQSGKVTFLTDKRGDRLDYYSAVPAPVSSTSDSVVWNFSNLAPLESRQINVSAILSLYNNINDTLISTARVEPIAGDANPADNVSLNSARVRSACDPNEIKVDIDTLIGQQVINPPYLDYTIRFQNTGNDSAVNITIVDTLPAALNGDSLIMLASSFPATVEFDAASHRLKFTLNNILLPDSNVNEPASHGAVHFKIKPIAGLPGGTTIKTHAGIIFDFNDPVITNTATTFLKATNGINQPVSNSLFIYPNPAQSSVIINYNGNVDNTVALVTDLTGRTILQQPFTKNTGTELSLDNIATGTYYIQLVRSGKIVGVKKLAVVK